MDVAQGGCILSCSQFEKCAGRELSKKWKERCDGQLACIVHISNPGLSKHGLCLLAGPVQCCTCCWLMS